MDTSDVPNDWCNDPNLAVKHCTFSSTAFSHTVLSFCGTSSAVSIVSMLHSSELDLTLESLTSTVLFEMVDRHHFLMVGSGFGGAEVACWPLIPNFEGSNPAEAVGFLKGDKNPQHTFLRNGSKIIGLMSQIWRHVKEPWVPPFLSHSSSSGC